MNMEEIEKRLAKLEAQKQPAVYNSWFHSTFSFDPPYNHNIVNLTALVLGSIFAGYTATAMDPDFLLLFETWPVQLVIFFIMSFSTLSHPITSGKLKFVLLDAVFALIVFRIVMYSVNGYYKKIKK